MQLAKPTPEQVRWQDMELEMFVCLDPCTWQDREYDDHSTTLTEINPARLDTDQWCRAAKSFGAGQILFVAKHTGGFCWWQTETTDYSIRSTPWRDGKGDVVAELSESCRRHGLEFAIYVYPGDDQWGAPAGSGGKTRDPAKQEAYNKVFRQQLTEVLTRYGRINEVWFDGSCAIDVSDILKEHASDAMIFQGPQATLRWVGNEAGFAPYPGWNSVRAEDGRSGVSTARHGDPDGDVWMPLEVDTTLRDHQWFWHPDAEHRIKSLETLMDCYYRSVGHGAVLLLNSQPDTSGLIPEADLAAYRAFGREIERRFGTALAETTGRGDEVVLDLGAPTRVDHVIAMEDIREGERVRRYVLEGFGEGAWKTLARGSAIGHKKIDFFEPVVVDKVRLRVTESAAEPLIRRLAALDVGTRPAWTHADPDSAQEDAGIAAQWSVAAHWEAGALNDAWQTVEINLSPHIPQAGQYEVRIVKTAGEGALESRNPALLLEGLESPESLEALDGGNAWNVSRTAVVTEEGDERTVLRVDLRASGAADLRAEARIRPAF